MVSSSGLDRMISRTSSTVLGDTREVCCSDLLSGESSTARSCTFVFGLSETLDTAVRKSPIIHKSLHDIVGWFRDIEESSGRPKESLGDCAEGRLIDKKLDAKTSGCLRPDTPRSTKLAPTEMATEVASQVSMGTADERAKWYVISGTKA